MQQTSDEADHGHCHGFEDSDYQNAPDLHENVPDFHIKNMVLLK